ncbi:hypothetical protein D915_005602 [Fasciola hepatica]|uniref:Uncharacterized protein n=1 Tax=Fasciola hepatica TaxID=6192 RepID=A0A4E0RYD7_FASHE|nr:hypothetical protein D915_005602 [Fasciola hepatica]
MGTLIPEDNMSYDEQLSSVLEACDRGDVKRLGEFIISGGELKDLFDMRGRNALHHCVRRLDEKIPDTKRNLFEQLDRIKCARIIVKTDSSFLTQLDSDGYSPMHLAVINNDVEFVRAIHEFRPPLEAKTRASGPKDNKSESQLSSGIGGRTVIHLAVLYAHVELLDSLLEMDVIDCINDLDEQGATALHYAVQLPQNLAPVVIESLVKNGKADLNSVDSHRRTALSWAATIGAHEAVTQLLKLGAKLNVADECGLTPLHCAASRGNRDIVQSMLHWISVANLDDPSKMATFRDVADKDGCTPIFYSVTMGHPEVTKCLLEYGANVQVQDAKGRSLAHCLARLGAVRTEENDEKVQHDKENAGKLLVQMTDLLEAGLNPWITTNTGAAPLHEACLLRNVDFVRELTKQTSFSQHVDARDSHGHTALHLVVAASWSSDAAGLELCEILLRNGANVNASTLLPQGGAVTALDLAIMNEKEENVARGKLRLLLETHGAKKFDQLCRFTKEETSDRRESKVVLDPPDSSVTGRIKRITPVEKRASRILVVSASAMNPESRDFIDANTQSMMTTLAPKPESRALIDTETNLEVKTNRKSEQTSRSAQTENINSHLKGHYKTGECKLAPTRISFQCQREVGSQFETPQSNEYVQKKPFGSTSSQNSKASSSSKHSTISSSTSVRVDTPSSSNTEPDQCGRFIRTEKFRGRVQSSAARSKGNSPYSQAYLERELPGILQRYLSHEEFRVSPMTGRSRMPKPTLSPYLVPLVPETNPMMGFPRKSGRKLGLHSKSPRRKPLAAHNADHPNPHKVRHQTPQQKSGTGFSCPSLHRTGSATKALISHPTNRKVVQQIVNQYFDHPPIHGSKITGKDKPRTGEKKTLKIPPGSHHQTTSAMGGEISPVGFQEDLDHKMRLGARSRQSSIDKKRSVKEVRPNGSESRTK